MANADFKLYTILQGLKTSCSFTTRDVYNQRLLVEGAENVQVFVVQVWDANKVEFRKEERLCQFNFFRGHQQEGFNNGVCFERVCGARFGAEVQFEVR